MLDFQVPQHARHMCLARARQAPQDDHHALWALRACGGQEEVPRGDEGDGPGGRGAALPLGGWRLSIGQPEW